MGECLHNNNNNNSTHNGEHGSTMIFQDVHQVNQKQASQILVCSKMDNFTISWSTPLQISQAQSYLISALPRALNRYHRLARGLKGSPCHALGQG